MTPNKFKYKTNILQVFLLVVLVVITTSNSFALETPVLTCVSVDGINGNTTLHWNNITDPDVVGVIIFSSANSFAFEIADIPIPSTSFTDLTVDANVEQMCYQLFTYDIGGVLSDPSEITCSVFIEIEASTLQTGFVQINIDGPYDNWANPPEPNYVLQFDIDGDLTMEAAPEYLINPTNLRYEVLTCPETEHYFNVYYQTSDCLALSNVAHDLFNDNSRPPIPFVSSLSVDTTSTPGVLLEWTMPEFSTSFINVAGYIVYECVEVGGTTINTPIATINDPNQMFYHIPVSLTDTQSYQYTVASFDTCTDDEGEILNLSATAENCDNSIVLTNITSSFNTCDYIVLEWNGYAGWAEGWQNNAIYVNPAQQVFGLGAFEVFKRENGGPYESISYGLDFPFFDSHYHDTIFNIDSQVYYEFYIKAHSFNNGYTANSNIYELNLASNSGPERTYISSANVINENEVEVTIKTDITFLEHDYIIQKRRDTDDFFLDLTIISNDTENFLYYTDTDVNTSEYSYEYRVEIRNFCEDSVGETNEARTMLCKVYTDDTALSNVINWSAYDSFDFPVDYYNVYRSTVQGTLGNKIGEVSGLSTTFVDPVIDDSFVTNLEVPAFFCYTVEAVEKSGNIHDFVGEAFSNQDCIQMKPEIYIPNAFILGGFNDEFKPVIILADFNQYRMQIYSISGNKVFESTDYEIGWKGAYNGTELADGAYGYIISIKDGSGNLHERSGQLFKLSKD